MDRTKTVIVIGAGAHVPYGYPTSEIFGKKFESIFQAIEKIKSDSTVKKIDNEIVQLKYENNKSLEFIEILEICRMMPLTDVFTPTGRFENFGISNKDAHMFVHLKLVYFLETFIINFFKSGSRSLDQSVMYKKEGRGIYELAKLLIAYLLYSYETRTKTYDNNWIEDYKDHFVLGEENITHIKNGNCHKIYTFNYDLNFERRLFWGLTLGIGLSNDEASEIVKKLNIHHVYGSFSTGLANSYDYTHLGNNEDWRKEKIVVNAARNISLIRENSIWKMQKQFQNDLENSEKIIFLGFGFDPSNTKILFDGLHSNKTCLSTNKFISLARAQKINDGLRQYGIKINFFERHLNEMDSQRLINDYLI